jgi:hypothetical protein
MTLNPWRTVKHLKRENEQLNAFIENHFNVGPMQRMYLKISDRDSTEIQIFTDSSHYLERSATND